MATYTGTMGPGTMGPGARKPSARERRANARRAVEPIASSPPASSGTRTETERSAPPLLPFEPNAFRTALARWFREHARELPWRGLRSPYATWLSEIMLQQTRVATVIERYSEFLNRFPTLQALAEAKEADVLALWSGLGYYRRARMLHRTAQFVMRELGGKLPHTLAELHALPGIGDYTAAAIASIAFGESAAAVDGNVERVLLRVLGLAEDRSGKARAHLAAVAQQLVPPAAARPGRSNPPGDHNQAMMELGATLCLPRSPLCLQCPVVDFCKTRGEHRTAPRGKPQSRQVAHLLNLRKRGVATEVLLERRPSTASLMPGMLELPPLPLDAVVHREPALRLRHSITDTNYYVEIYAEGAAGVTPVDPGSGPLAEEEDWPERLLSTEPADSTSSTKMATPERFAELLGELVEASASIQEGEAGDELTGELLHATAAGSATQLLNLRNLVPAAAADLQWFSLSAMYNLPLTGLARKCLQRLRLMPTRRVRLE